MKKQLSMALLLGASAVAGVAEAQFYVVKDGKLLFDTKSTPDYVTFEHPMLCGGVIGDAVDLGLSVRWSSVNVGASAPEDYGNYYAWGETAAKTDYSWATYQFMDHETDGYKDSWKGITKYTVADNQKSGKWYSGDDFVGDGKTVLDPADDAAAANWGGGWRMPTHEEWVELYEQCLWMWTSDYNGTGVAGTIVYKVKDEADRDKHQTNNGGPQNPTTVATYTTADVHIFLPASGWRDGASVGGLGSYGDYWSASVVGYSDYAWGTYFTSDGANPDYTYDRYYGRPVRPVCPSSE